MLRRRRQNQPGVSVNITPLVDVLLVLIVVLMLALPMYVKRLPVDLPQTSLAGTPVPVKALPLALGPDEALFLRGAEVPIAQILSQVGPGVTVELSVDKNARYETMAKLLAQVQAKNPKEIVLLTR